MDYDNGLVQLQEQLKKLDDEEAVRRTAILGRQLRALLKRLDSKPNDTDLSPELQSVLAELDKVAYRTVGTSFASLCNCSRPSFLDRTQKKCLFSALS